MNTETLKTFITLSQFRNYSITAQHMFVAQSTVTTRISELEKELGEQLFVRSHKKLELTEQGNIFYDYASRILDLENEVYNQFKSRKQYKNHIRVGTTDTLYECYVEAQISQYLQNNSDCSCKIEINHSIVSLQMIQDNLLDIVYSFVKFNKSGYICEHFITDPLVIVTSPQNDPYIDGITLKKFQELNIIFLNFTINSLGMHLRELFPPHFHFFLEINYCSKSLSLLFNGLGYSMQPRSLVQQYLDNGKLISIEPLDFTLPAINCYRIFKEGYIDSF